MEQLDLFSLISRRAAVEKELNDLKASLTEIEGALNLQLDEGLKAAQVKAGKDTGTFRFTVDGIQIKATVGKTVKWDQEQMETIWDTITSANDDPRQYIERKFGVSESAYKHWPQSIVEVFEAARSVTPGKPKFEFSMP